MRNLLILPACGNAIRIGSIPKFLLPVTAKKSLLTNILNMVSTNDMEIWLSTKPEYASMMYSMFGDQLNIKVAQTSTMSETVLEYQNVLHDQYMLMMPDTYINDTTIVDRMLETLDHAEVACAVWKIKDYQRGKLGQCKLDENSLITDVIDKDKNCPYDYFWGSIAWKPSFWKYIKSEMNHIGHALKPAIDGGLTVKAVFADGIYNDCGTIEEYTQLLTSMN